MFVCGFLDVGLLYCGVFGLLIGAVRCFKGLAQHGAWSRAGGGGSPRATHVHRVVGVVPSSSMVYLSACWRWVMRTYGAVNSCTRVVSGRWRVTVILAAWLFRVVVCGTM